MIPGTTYRQTRIQIDPNDILVLYTDGITEAQDSSGDMFGRERLMASARTAPIGSAAAAGQHLLEDLRDFRQDNYTDDETIIAIQRGAQS